ncbi:MAG: tetratricopeptide repeat protein [Gemmatimonadota bacterium]
MGRRDGPAIREARDLLLQAIELDPLDAATYALLAQAYSGLAYYSELAPETAFPAAEAAARQALEIDPTVAFARAAIASSLTSFRWHWAAAEREFKVAIEHDPDNAATRNLYGIMLRNIGRFDEAIVQFREAARLEPLSRHYHRQIGTALHCAGRLTEAVTEYRLAIDLDPRYSNGWEYLAFALARLGRYDEALTALATVARTDRDSAKLAAYSGLRGREGYVEALRRDGRSSLEGLRSTPPGRYVSDADFATAYEWLGQFDEMYRRLARAVDRRDVRALTFDCPDNGIPLDRDARYAEIKRRIANP